MAWVSTLSHAPSPAGTSGRFEIKDRFLPMGGRGGRGGYAGGRGYSLVLGDEHEEHARQVGWPWQVAQPCN